VVVVAEDAGGGAEDLRTVIECGVHDTEVPAGDRSDVGVEGAVGGSRRSREFAPMSRRRARADSAPTTRR
jgi:hypothetical protein